MQSNTLPRTNAAGALQIAPTKQQTQQQSHHQHTASWSYYPEQVKKTGDSYGNYYHLPAHTRHSYHGHEAIYQNCHTMTVQQTQAIIPGHVHQKLTQQASQPQIQAIQHAQQINRLSQYARSPTRRPESPPPLRNYHQTMVLIPYKPDGTTGYPSYGIAGETSENIYQRQHNIVEYQQVNDTKSMNFETNFYLFRFVTGNTANDSCSDWISAARHATARGVGRQPWCTANASLRDLAAAKFGAGLAEVQLSR